jgi:zinc transport system substrate-binding protein
MNRFLLHIIVVSFLFLVGCGKAEDPSGKVSVVVSIAPQADFVRRIAGDNVDVIVAIPPGQSPHAYAPSLRQMMQISKSTLFFKLHLPFEKTLLNKLKGMDTNLIMVDTCEGITFRLMEAAGEHHHDEGDKDDNFEHGDFHDPHVWLNPANVRIMAGHIRDALKEADPAHAAYYETNCAAFVAELDAVDKRIRDALAPLKNREIMVFHPAFGYFTDAYDLKQLPVEIEGKAPTTQALTKLIQEAKSKGIKVIFVQPQFSTQRAQMIAETIGGVVIPMDPLAADYLANLDDMAHKVAKALQ